MRRTLYGLVLAVASAPLLLALAERQLPAATPQRATHVALQTHQFNRVRAAMVLSERTNAPGVAPAAIHTMSPAAPGYLWRLNGDVPSAPSLLPRFEADPVRVMSGPTQPQYAELVTE